MWQTVFSVKRLFSRFLHYLVIDALCNTKAEGWKLDYAAALQIAWTTGSPMCPWTFCLLTFYHFVFTEEFWQGLEHNYILSCLLLATDSPNHLKRKTHQHGLYCNWTLHAGWLQETMRNWQMFTIRGNRSLNDSMHALLHAYFDQGHSYDVI